MNNLFSTGIVIGEMSMFNKIMFALLVMITGLCYGQSWREKPLSRATFRQHGVKHIQIIAHLEKSIISYPPQLKGINFNPERFSLNQSSSFYNAAIDWEERDYEDPEIIKSHVLDSSSTCPITVNEEELLNLLIEFKVLRISRAPAHTKLTLPGSYDYFLFTLIYDSIGVTSFLEKCEELPCVQYVNVPIVSGGLLRPSKTDPKPHGCLENKMQINNHGCPGLLANRVSVCPNLPL